MASIFFQIRDPDSVQFTAHITMPLSEWKKVRSALETPNGIVAWSLWNEIGKAVSDATTLHTRYFEPENTTD